MPQINYYVCDGGCETSGDTFTNDSTCGGGCDAGCTCKLANQNITSGGGGGVNPIFLGKSSDTDPTDDMGFRRGENRPVLPADANFDGAAVKQNWIPLVVLGLSLVVGIGISEWATKKYIK